MKTAMEMTQAEREVKAAELRAMADEQWRRKEESFARSDTDGFLSQWASGLSDSKYRLEASIVENGGLSSFAALFNLEGERVRAKLYYGPYGACWMFCDELNKPTGKFISAYPRRESTMTKKGYREGWEDAPAKAEISGGKGKGLSGAASCSVVSKRMDDGYPEDAIIE